MTRSTDPFVRIQDLAISYRTAQGRPPVHVVHDVSLQVELGQTLAIVGESGSGKSTVARTLLGYLRPGSFVRGGSVTVGGQDVFALKGPELRELRGGTVALVAQNAGQALTPSMRIGKQVAEALTVHGGAASDERVAELLDQVALPNRLARSYPHELSGGQQQRVAIAMAVAARPQALVLDEPTTALDVVTQAGVLRLLRDLSDELNAATLLVSHDLGVVAGMADDVLVMRDGRQVEYRPARELFAAPADDYTRMLLASAPRLTDDGLVEVTDDGTRRVRSRVDVRDTEALIRGSDVRVTYGRGSRAVHAVNGVDLEVRRGEVVALVGESGSGKSTLAWSVAGLTPPSGGALTYSGGAATDPEGTEVAEADLTKPVRRRPLGLRRRIQLVFQNADTALNPRLTVGTSIRRPLQLFRTARGKEKQRVGELLGQVELPAEFARRLPGQLSGGQRQRIGIARALAGDPTVIIADEITTALDVSVQASVLRLLDDIRRENRLACIFISHDLAVVRGIADRVLVMHDALVVEEGLTAAVFGNPRHPYTRELLSATLVVPDGASATAQGPSGDAEWVMQDPLAQAGSERTWKPDPDGAWEDHGDGHRSRAWLPVDAPSEHP
ncbi:ABC transporter ATP-binding protein [Tessaracoccus oleiagri]|uniref:Peptide/nickel transport system ATP-binding protein n=1 Tax=Tessaracoccus oleiagri TaxID=686624 RepID=A0A1G9IC35_9ACTN|nr:ABC transporter ATP-binding protein [Tessaracoccus oleiagri]SDL22615.1 peptide/nickel transport system ATP-binding protein [Tessaracoccus oleiagri]